MEEKAPARRGTRPKPSRASRSTQAPRRGVEFLLFINLRKLPGRGLSDPLHLPTGTSGRRQLEQHPARPKTKGGHGPVGAVMRPARRDRGPRYRVAMHRQDVPWCRPQPTAPASPRGGDPQLGRALFGVGPLARMEDLGASLDLARRTAPQPARPHGVDVGYGQG